MIKLYDDQEEFVGNVRREMASHNAVIGVSPTGSGKTVMFSYIASRARERGRRIGIFAHRAELLTQISEALKLFRVPHGIISAGASVDLRHTVYVCSAQTYARRGVQAPRIDLGIIDEAHHCTTGSTWAKCMDRSPDARWLGVTATPERLDGRGLGEIFTSMVIGMTVRELIDLKRLSDYRLFAPGGMDLSAVHTLGGDYNRGELNEVADKPAITGNAIEHYRKYLNGAPSAAFCVSIAHAVHVAEEFRAAGFTAASIDGKMDKTERARIVRDFRDGRINVLSSCDLISEGFDVPGMHGAILLRPTKSTALYLQQVGRALRICGGKDKATILDHCSNSDDANHGLPCLERPWSLEGRKKTAQAAEPSMSRECGVCFARVPLSRVQCPECGTQFPVRVREVEQREGDLEEVDVEKRRKEPTPERKAALRVQGMAKSESALIDLFQRQMAEKLGRALSAEEMQRQVRRAGHVMNARQEKRRA
ncbi:MAG TPA: DEAD/DEAH box helicase [Gammaproteobacteria bacterium]|nr:DEAD/DEAH box helicase [Gammaproteobacteria bacterium]